MKIGIVTDTSCNFTPEQAEELGIHLVPLDIIFKDRTYVDAFEMTTEEFYKKMSELDGLPTTSQPAIGEFIKVYKEIIEDYDQIISIHLSGDLSGTVSTAKMAAKQVDSEKIKVYDTKLVSILSKYLVLEAKRLVEQGEAFEQIIERLDDAKPKSIAYIVIESLDSAIKGGRVPKIAGKITEMAQIKAIFKVSNNGIELERVIRTSKRAYKSLEKKVYDYIDSLDYPVIVEIAHGDIHETAEAYKERLLVKYPDQVGRIHRLTGVIGVHSGPKIIGLTTTPDYLQMEKHGISNISLNSSSL